jgi:hypothetical protein
VGCRGTSRVSAKKNSRICDECLLAMSICTTRSSAVGGCALERFVRDDEGWARGSEEAAAEESGLRR